MLWKLFHRAILHTNKLILYDLRQYGVNAQEHSISNIPSLELEQKLLKVAIIGIPNAGKSTFINNLMDRKVCPTSSKVHTTRSKSQAIFTEQESQIVFLDTPGIVNDREQKRHKLEASFNKDSKACLKQADIIGVLHDVSNIWTREKLDVKIIKLLQYYISIPSFLVINKVDILQSKRKLLDITRILTENSLDGKPILSNKPLKEKHLGFKGWPHFKDVFMVSALTGSGLPEIKEYLIKHAAPGKWMYPPEVYSDQSVEAIITNTVKATLLNFLPQEIPYQLKPYIELLEYTEEGAIKTVVLVECPTARISRLVAGVSDGRLRQITESVQRDLQNAFQQFVRIRIVLKEPKSDK